MPPESAPLAREGQAFQRARVRKSPAALLSLGLLYRIGELALREIAGVWAGRGNPRTDEAVRQRLAACPKGVEGLLGQLGPTSRLPERSAGQGQLLLCDGAQSSGPGAQGTDYRGHGAYAPGAQQIRELPVSDVQTGASVTRFALGTGTGVGGEPFRGRFLS